SGSAARTTGSWSMTFSTFDTGINLFSSRDIIFEDNYVAGQISTTSVTVWTSFQRNLLVKTTSGNEHNVSGDVTDCYVVEDTASVNPHGINVFSNDFPSSTISGCIFDYTDVDDNGDHVLLGTGATSAKTVTIRNNIAVPNAQGKNSGTVFSALGN